MLREQNVKQDRKDTPFHPLRRRPVPAPSLPRSVREAAARAASTPRPRARAMRTPESSNRRGPLQFGAPTTASVGVLAWNRMAFGPGAGDLAAFEALGADDDARLTAFVDQQLDPASIDDGDADARIQQSGYTTLDKSLAQLWQDHAVNDEDWRDRIRPIVETTFVTFLRAVHSKRQLFEVMTDFWHNHFSVYGWEFYEAPTWVHYDRDVIRANALGNFRTLLEATAKSTPMLIYLDNFLNSSDGPNENYARELLELHTLGDEHYYGAIPRDQVPIGGDGLQVGFVDEDVFAVTRALTGWSLDANPWWDLHSGNGGYFYRSEWHDTDSKNVLGQVLPAGQQEQDGLTVLDLIASHAGTARFISRKLCRRFLGDFPPESIVDAAAATFLAHTASSDQIARVVRTILLSQEFRDSWGLKLKRPFELMVSAMRSVDSQFPFIEDDDESESLDWRFYQTGHYPFAWHPPNGYPDFGEAWVSSSPRVMTWRLTNWLVDFDWDDAVWRHDVAALTPSGVRSANEIVDYWSDRILGRSLTSTDRQRVVEFMAQGHNPDLDLPLDSDDDTQSRLQSLVGLFFMSPEFLWR